MRQIPGKQSKSTQYIIGGVVAVIILFLWISIPLMSNSSLDSSVSGNPFKSRPADLNSLGSDIPSEGGAPGYALNGSMIDNPATSGEMIASSLFQMGPGDAEAPGLEDLAASGSASGSSAGGGAFAGGPAGPAHKGKLNMVGSLGSGGGGSMSMGGGKHDQMLGKGSAKAELAPLSGQNTKGPGTDKKNAVLAALQNTELKSVRAAQSTSMAGARGGATSGFEKVKSNTGLNTGAEGSAAGAGISGSGASAASDLKKSDPRMNKAAFKPPTPEQKEDKSKQADEEFKKLMMQMIIQYVLGPMIQGMVTGMMAG